MLSLATLIASAAACGFAALSWSLHRDAARRSAARVAVLSASIDGPPRPASGEAVGAFEPEQAPAQQDHPASHRQGIAILATAIAIPIVLAGFALSTSRVPSAPKPVASRAPATLELIGMHHTRQGGVLKVVGTVRVRGQHTAAVTAVVTAFDAHGTIVARARGSLEDARLDALGESSFEVDVPAPPGVERYRVRFETPLGTLSHVDRRGDGTLGPRAD